MNAVSFKLVGDWRKQIAVTLDQALTVSQDVFRRSAGEACKHAVILMAQSLSSKSSPLTPTSAKSRPVMQDSKGEYVERWRQGWSNPQKVYKWFFSKVHDRQGNIKQVKNFSGSEMDAAGWERAQVIKSAGLARRSWMWGLGQWGGQEDRTPISGTSEVYYNETAEKVEAVKRNKLGYILKIMSAGWLEQATERAKNKIMAQAARNMEKNFISTIRSGRLSEAKSVKSFFLPEAA